MILWRKNQVKDVLNNKLEIAFGSGKELTGWFIYKSIKVTRVSIPKGRDHLTKGTQKAIRESLRLNSSEFDDLMDCPLRYDEYVDLLKNRGYINW